MASKNETRKKKAELDELRKLGVAPAQEDEDGFYINPHIPAYMADAPWYIDRGVSSLKHQRLETRDHGKAQEISIHHFQKKGVKKTRAKRYVRGACENCGSRTHKTKHCVERPRKRKAVHTNKNIANDEHLPENLKLGWDGKRDRWANYDTTMHQFEIKKWNKVEELRKRKREAELIRRMKEGTAEEQRKARKKLNKLNQKRTGVVTNDDDSDSDSDSDESDESDDEMADSGKVIQNFDVKHRQTVRNLRIREDMPKYLRNLDVDSAFYDPKTRSMRANPYSNVAPEDRHDDYRGDINTLRSGEVNTFNLMNKFSMKAQQIHGMEVAGNMLISSNPTSTELAFKNHAEKRKEKTLSKELLDKYGGMQHLNQKTNVPAQSEVYVEYLPDGRTKEQPKMVTRSKYTENEFSSGHSSVWGSYYDRSSGTWGYACCKATTYSAYCTAVKRNPAAPTKRKQKPDGKKQKKGHKRVMGVMAKPSEYFDLEKKTLKSGYLAVRGVATQAKMDAGLTEPPAKKQRLE